MEGYALTVEEVRAAAEAQAHHPGAMRHGAEVLQRQALPHVTYYWAVRVNQRSNGRVHRFAQLAASAPESLHALPATPGSHHAPPRP